MIQLNDIMLANDIRLTDIYPATLLNDELCPSSTSIYNLLYQCIAQTMMIQVSTPSRHH